MTLIVEKYYKGKQYATVTTEAYTVEDLAFKLNQMGISERLEDLVMALEQDTVVYKIDTPAEGTVH